MNTPSVRRFTRFTHLASLALSAALAGCGGATLDEGNAAEALDSVESSSTESALSVPALDGASAQMTAEQAALNAAAKAGTFYQPPGCVTATPSGSRVTYVLKDCTGPRGLLHVTGTVLADFTQGKGALLVHLTSTGLAVNAATLDLDSQVVYTASGGSKSATVTTTSTGTGQRGNRFTHTGSYTATWDDSCVAVDGTWSTRVGLATWSTAVAGWRRCAGMCPAAGGSVTHTGAGGVVITVTTDGSGSAKWSSSRGRSGTVDLYCE